MKRIVLKVHLLKDNGLKIKLYHLDKRFLTNKKSTNFYHNDNFTFIIYSNKKMFLSHNSFRVPDEENYKNEQEYTHYFISEKERYEYLKKLYNTLHKWNDDYLEFRKSNDHNKRNKKMILSGEFWVI